QIVTADARRVVVDLDPPRREVDLGLLHPVERGQRLLNLGDAGGAVQLLAAQQGLLGGVQSSVLPRRGNPLPAPVSTVGETVGRLNDPDQLAAGDWGE